MRSIKPGRGPSKMAGFFWLFGVLFVVWGVVQAVYNFRNAGQKNRYSAFDITDEREEPDPLNERFGSPADETPQEDYDPDGGTNFCPYCGEKTGPEYAFCPNCGRKLPE